MIRLRHRSERGAALIEALLVTPVFFVLVLGIFEFGLIYRDVLTVSDAAGTGARAGAVVGPRVVASGANADFMIIRSVRESLGRIPAEWIDRVVIFKSQAPGAGGPLAQIPSSCRQGTPVSGRCNVYETKSAFYAVQSGDITYFDCSLGAEPSCFWPPASRSNGPNVNEIDYLGVYIRLERPYISGLFGDVFTIEHAEVVRLEPGVINP